MGKNSWQGAAGNWQLKDKGQMTAKASRHLPAVSLGHCAWLSVGMGHGAYGRDFEFRIADLKSRRQESGARSQNLEFRSEVSAFVFVFPDT